MGKTLLVSLSALFVLSAGLFVALERPSWVPVVGEEEEPVLVFLVGHRKGVDLMKRAVDPQRIVAESPDAIALAEGRIVATGAEAVSAPLMAAGWGDRTIELLRVPPRDTNGPGADGEGTDPRFARIMELVNKPTLSYGEALVVMQAMNDGVI